MHRRSFVRASVLGATTSGLAPACGPSATGSRAPAGRDDEFANRLAELDRGMEDLRCRPIDLGRVASRAANTPLVCREDPLDEQLYRSSLRALLLTSSLKDLPEADRARPEVQTRLDAHAAEVDFAVDGMTQRLAHMSAEDMARVQERLRGDPELPRRIIESIDDEARKSDFPLARRLRLRRLARIALWRLRRQPAQLLIDECTDKVHRLAERLTPIAREAPFARPPAADVAYWEAQTLRVALRYQDPAPGEPARPPDPQVGEADAQRAVADQQRAKAEALVATQRARAVLEFQTAGALYERAAARLDESYEHVTARSQLLDLTVAMYLRSYELKPDAAPLRAALIVLRAHDEQFRLAYGEQGRLALPEYARLEAHMIQIQNLLLRLQSGDDSGPRRKAPLVRVGGIIVGVGLGLLLLGLGLVLGAGVFVGAVLATVAGLALIVGLIIMIVGAVIKA